MPAIIKASLQTALASWVVLSLGGCTTAGFATISEPALSSESAAYASAEQPGIFFLDGLRISVKPQNADVSLLTAGIIVPVVPLGPGNKVREGKPFRLAVQFEHDGGDFSYAAASTIVELQSGVVSVVEIAGPLTRITSPRELERIAVGHPWVCTWDEDDFKRAIPAAAVIPTKSCVLLEFSVPTPSPQESFSVVLGGLKKGEATLPDLKIEFSPGRSATMSGMY